LYEHLQEPPIAPLQDTPDFDEVTEVVIHEEAPNSSEPHDLLEAISEDELMEVEAVSDRQPEVQPRRRLPKRPAPRTSFTDGSGADERRRHWWEELWSDDFLRTELPQPPEALQRQVDFIDASLALERGGVVLDLACGGGAYSVELARRGYNAVGYDLSELQLERAKALAKQHGQKVNFLQGDAREMSFDSAFDGVLCWDSSFGYFEEERNAALLSNVFRALKPGGGFLLDVANRDYVLRHQPMQSWFEGEGCVCMDDTYIDFITSRLSVKRTVMLDDGRNREWLYSLRLYSLHEVGKMLHEVGFKVVQVSGDVTTRGAFLGGYSPRLIVLAVKPSQV
jgi:SAM-dependent methyltransferase